MSDVIGATDGMPELGAELAQKIQSGLITSMYVQDWRVRAKAAAAHRDADVLSRAQASARVHQLAGDGLAAAAGKAAAVRDRDAGQASAGDYLGVWAEAVDGRYGAQSATIQGHCEQVLRGLSPALMAGYDQAVAAGQQPTAAMRAAASGLVTTGRGRAGHADAAAAGSSAAEKSAEAADPGPAVRPGAWPPGYTQHVGSAGAGAVADLGEHRARRSTRTTSATSAGVVRR